jgi:hypothetical protein
MTAQPVLRSTSTSTNANQQNHQAARKRAYVGDNEDGERKVKRARTAGPEGGRAAAFKAAFAAQRKVKRARALTPARTAGPEGGRAAVFKATFAAQRKVKRARALTPARTAGPEGGWAAAFAARNNTHVGTGDEDVPPSKRARMDTHMGGDEDDGWATAFAAHINTHVGTEIK